VVAFGELTPGSRHASGKANQEVCAEEGKAIDRVLELDEDFFPDWDREETYQVGERVKFGEFVFRALQENNPDDFLLPDLELDPEAEVATPKNRSARWVEVYDPNYEEESYGGPI